jgi:glycosyltransferase involved in cell wall biosynthesis
MISMNNVALPRIAVITPFFDSEKWLKECMDSVAAQDYPNIVHALVDDRSTDLSFDLVYGELENCVLVNQTTDAYYYQGTYKNRPVLLIKLVKNGKQGRARNFAIKALWNHVQGFILADADDIMLPHKTSRMVETWLRDPETIGCVANDHDTVDVNTGTVVREYHPPYSKDALHQSCIVHSQYFMSKLAIEGCGLFMEDTVCKEDYGQLLKISNMFMIVNIPESLNIYRTHPENSSVSTSQEKHREYFDIMVKNYNVWLASPQGYNGK